VAWVLKHYLFSLLFFPVFLANGLSHGANPAQIAIDSFGQEVIENYAGCQFAFWQGEKQPDLGSQAYVFFAPIHDSIELPAWVKIDEHIVEFSKQNSSETKNQDNSENAHKQLPAIQTYKAKATDGATQWIILEIKQQSLQGNTFHISDAELTFIQADKLSQTLQVKGHLYCPESAYADEQNHQTVQAQYTIDGEPITLKLLAESTSIEQIPTLMRKHLKQHAQYCDVENTAGYSAQYAISPDMSLWQLPCNLYAYNASAVFYVSLNNNSEHFVGLFFNSPHQAAPSQIENAEILNPTIDEKRGVIISQDQSANGCGFYKEYALRAVEGEAVEAFLIEERRKEQCDGVQIEPKNMPLVYEMPLGYKANMPQ